MQIEQSGAGPTTLTQFNQQRAVPVIVMLVAHPSHVVPTMVWFELLCPRHPDACGTQTRPGLWVEQPDATSSAHDALPGAAPCPARVARPAMMARPAPP